MMGMETDTAGMKPPEHRSGPPVKKVTREEAVAAARAIAEPSGLDGGTSLWERLTHVLDHRQFRRMPPGKQVLYLQLLRWTHGCGRELVEASRMDMCGWTGLAPETIKKYLPQLIDEGLVKKVRESTPINPAAYQVNWLPPPSPSPDEIHPTRISYYVDQLNEKERMECRRIEQLLTREERRQIQSIVTQSLRTLGIPWDYELIKKLITWYHLTHSPYLDQLEMDHPDWFATPSQFKS
jgi:hypothetical protein